MKRIITYTALLAALCLMLNSCGTLAALVYMGITADSEQSEVIVTTTPTYNDEMNAPPQTNGDESGNDPNDPGDPDDKDNELTERPDHTPEEPELQPPMEPELPLVDYEVQLIEEMNAEWRYLTTTVIWESYDYVRRVVDEFGDFIEENPDWAYPYFDDRHWGTHRGPLGDRISYANAERTNWIGENHGLFARTTFNLTSEEISSIKNGDAGLYAWAWYDNSCHIYINGVEVFAHDDSDLFVEGVPAEDVGVHDWIDSYKVLWFDESNGQYTYQGNVADILAEGENTIAVSMLDCWGGRELDLGLYIGYYE